LYDLQSKVNAADRYLGLLEELEATLETKIDLVDIRAARNPLFHRQRTSAPRDALCRVN
jgi:hypothetical protein